MINELEQMTPASTAFNSSLRFKTGFIFVIQNKGRIHLMECVSESLASIHCIHVADRFWKSWKVNTPAEP